MPWKSSDPQNWLQIPDVLNKDLYDMKNDQKVNVIDGEMFFFIVKMKKHFDLEER